MRPERSLWPVWVIGRAEEFLRHLQMDARAVAGLAVGVHRAAVPHGFQRLDPARDDFAARLAVDGGHQPDAAGIVLLLRRIGMRVLEPLGVLEIAGDVALGGAHGVSSFA